LHNSTAKPKTLFATHYHELNELESRLDRVRNFHITNRESGNKVIFLRKLARGGSTHSFGIHVAKMAGMPPSLIDRANQILAQLETKQVDEDDSPLESKKQKLDKKIQQISGPQLQLSIFDAHSEVFDDIRNTLNGIDINRLTPVEALLKLNEIKQKIK
jgi:DNA mismatch repair protein MutS